MSIQNSALRHISYRTVSWIAIASGAIGVVATGFLIAYLVLRSTNPDQGVLMGRLHDVGVSIQTLLMIPVVIALHKRSNQLDLVMSKTRLIIGIGSLTCSAFFLLLGLTQVIADVLYMFPQGIFGAWLVVFCLRNKGVLSVGLSWFGILVGFGLAFVGLFPLEYALFVDPIILKIPAADPETIEKIPIDATNRIVHQVLFIGSPMGVLTLPFWTLLLGRWLHRTI
ncbi:hypothetical protein [Spirosoma endbachense]|uniref:Uncharacterized protein n=1 Tax=Spirosoma endbachense TaxID=2666025 RepID=A0A6P1W403_9BACT|nr:hypothetical protein [Spirosoma endbachense]QHW00144.1 hypothetical protein GJR95_36270 [Spirosoma endbachense]